MRPPAADRAPHDLDDTLAAHSVRLRQIRDYWESTTQLYLDHLGTTFQAVRHPRGPARTAATELNLYLAAAAGIRPGDRVLDAGCGVCGPSIDIARAFHGVSIEGVTLSPTQAKVGRTLVHDSGLEHQIQLSVADFHALPFRDTSFDVALFLETACYSRDLVGLFSGVWRVLRPGGKLYVKDVFSIDAPLTARQEAELDRLREIFVLHTTSLRRTADAVVAAGFSDVEARSLDGELSFGPALETYFSVRHGFPVLNEFGARHFQDYEHLPTTCGQITALKRTRA
jgi:ubiquinone/menaquinone biosynthesis C-methylase UbiE